MPGLSGNIPGLLVHRRLSIIFPRENLAFKLKLPFASRYKITAVQNKCVKMSSGGEETQTIKRRFIEMTTRTRPKDCLASLTSPTLVDPRSNPEPAGLRRL